MVTIRRPRGEEQRQFMRGARFPNISSNTEFRVITLQDPIVDPEWMFHHPRFRRETKTSGSLPHNERWFINAKKKVHCRVPSATGNARSKILCERRERDQGKSTCRHFCELLGPNLCKECWKLVQRTDAFNEHRDSYPSAFISGKDPFSAMIASHEKRRMEYNDSDEEILVETEDEEFISKSIGSRKASSISSPQDSGYSSRMSYIRSLSRSPSGDFCPRVTSRSKFTRGGVRSRTSDDEREISANNQRRSSEVDNESTPIWKNAYLAKLREREPFREILTKNILYPKKLRHAWRDLPVEPVVMDLKLINFTIYDGKKLNERATKGSKA
ncbi:hypothetical protein ACROYT_G000505 [Oculina patagonica]